MSLPEKLASIGPREDQQTGGGPGASPGGGQLGPGIVGKGGGGGGGEPPDPNDGLMQRIIVIRRDEKGYGFTVSGDNPVFVASVKTDGAASKAGLQQGDKIIKVNGTLVTNRNHLDVVKLIKSGSYVALTLRGKRTSTGGGGGGGSLVGVSAGIPQTPAPNIAGNRDPGGGRVTAPLPVDPDKDRELQQQRINMTRSMYETAKEDFEKHQQQYVDCPSDKLHAQLLEKERTKKALENQLRILTGAGDEATTPTSASRPGSNRYSDSEHSGLVQSWQHQAPHPGTTAHHHPPPVGNLRRHVKQGSVPSLLYRSRGPEAAAVASSTAVARSKSDAASRRSKGASSFYVGLMGSSGQQNQQQSSDTVSEAKKSYFQLKRASSLPTTTSDLGSMSDSPQTSPSVSPTPNDAFHQRPNGQEMVDSMIGSTGQDIITIDDEDIHSEEDQANDPGPFADIKMLDNKPAHMAILLNYLITNSDPSPVLFQIISDSYSRNSGSTKELRKWAYEIFSTFIPQMAPLRVSVEDNIISQLDNTLNSASRTDNETLLRNMFSQARQAVQRDIADLLADFRNKRDLGMANLYGLQKVYDNMDRATEVKVAEELLIPHLDAVSEDNNSRARERDQAIGWSLATFLRQVGGSKSAHSSTLDRVQTFMMKDKRIKFPGSRSNRAKGVKGHQFNLQHFYTTTFCNFCGHLIGGVGYQGYQCQSCEMTLHKHCVEEITETCGGKQKKRVSKLIPVMPSTRRYSSNSSNSSQSALSQLYQQAGMKTTWADQPDQTGLATQPYPKDDEVDLAGLPTGHGVKDIINRYQDLASPTGLGPSAGLDVPGGDNVDQAASAGNRKGSSDLNRSGSLNNKGEKSDRPARRAKSDVDVDSDMFKAINQSGSSSASSLSNRSMESPSQSTEGVNASPDAALRAVLHEADSDFELDSEPRSLQELLGDDVLRKLKPKEKKRQEVINELFYTERNHLRNLHVLDKLFNRPMQQERGVKVMFELAFALFPNMDEMIALHETLVQDIKVRSKNMPVKEVGDILLKRFDGEAGEKFRKGCAEYCRNQAFALEALKKHTKKEPKLAQFLIDAELNPQCRRLQLKDLVPSQMQRLTKYPLLIDNLMKHTQSHSEEYKRLEQAHEKCKHILAYVNQAVKECESYHKLRDIQRKLDTRSIDPTDESMTEVKKLDLLQHKLIYDGPLTWKLRSHGKLELHLLLFETMLVLLQRQDDKYVLKFIEEHKFSYSPVLYLKNVIVRNLATDKKVFFVVNMADVGAQMYEFTAATSELRIKWCKLIEDRADELKRQGGSGGGTGGPAVRSQSLHQPPTSERVELERSKTTRISRKSRSVRNPNTGSADDSPPLSPPPTSTVPPSSNLDDRVDGLTTIGDDDEEGEGEDGVDSGRRPLGGHLVVTTTSGDASQLIQPDEVRVDSAVVVQAAEPVRSPLERLKENTELIHSALEEQGRLLSEVLRVQAPLAGRLRAGSQRVAESDREAPGDGTNTDGGSGTPRRGAKTRRRSNSGGAASIKERAADQDGDVSQTEGQEGDGGGEEGVKLEDVEVIAEEVEEEEETPEALVAKALRLNSSFLLLVVDPESGVLSPSPRPRDQDGGSSSLLSSSIEEEQHHHDGETCSIPAGVPSSSSSQPLSMLGEGAPSSLDTNPTSPTTTSTAQMTTQQQKKKAASSQPKEQLMKMQAEMNTIFVKLQGAMNSGREERHRLREELAEVQQMLAALKEQQRQMTEAGVVPPDKVLQHFDEKCNLRPTAPPVIAGSDIPQPSCSAAQPPQPTTTQELQSVVEVEAVSPTTRLDESTQQPQSPSTSSTQSHEQTQQQQPQILTSQLPSTTAESTTQPEEGEKEECGAIVHHGVEEETAITQLEESVEALTVTSAKVTDVIEVAMREDDGEEMSLLDNAGKEEDFDDDDDDDDLDNNEVSVKDLPLPDVNISIQEVVDNNASGPTAAIPSSSSSLLDAVDLDEESESEGEEEGRGEGPTTSLTTDTTQAPGEHLQKISEESSSSDADVVVPGGHQQREGNNNKQEGENEGSSDEPPSSCVDGETTSPIEI